MSSKERELLKGPMKSLKVSWRMVLVRPRNPLNIGAAARAWANFGWREMLVVAPFEPTWEEARSSAVGAGQLMKSARAVPHIMEAIGDMTLVIGTTTGARRQLERDLCRYPIWQLGCAGGSSKAAPPCFSAQRRRAFPTRT